MNVEPEARWRTANSSIASAGKIHADRGIGPCALMRSSPYRFVDDYASTAAASPPCKADEMSRRFDRAEIVQIVVAASGKADELFRLVGQRKQPLAEGYRNGRDRSRRA